ncbi:MAG TPA: DUF2252 domain-containing protein [Candidatus Limnocylindria bacterium]
MGEQARTRLPPAAQGDWSPASTRADPIALLEQQSASRVPELVAIRHGRMMVSLGTYFRGAALAMAADLAATPVTGINVQLGGDAHLSNFGLYASPERDLLFDMNDFDETLPGPWEWDLKRLAASIVIAGRVRGFATEKTKHAAHAAVRSYRERMHAFAAMSAMDVYYSRVDAVAVTEFVDKRARAQLEATVKAARHHDAIHDIPKLTRVVDGRLRLVDQPPTVYHPAWSDTSIPVDALSAYSKTMEDDRRALLDRFEFVDAAVKVVGVGSVGLYAFVALFVERGTDHPLFLQVKEAQASVLERFLRRSAYPNHGERVVVGQRRLQAASDIFLGWVSGRAGRHFYVRQLQDQKGSATLDTMTFEDLLAWGEVCGWALARGHARTGEPASIAAYLGEDDAMDRAIGRFAVAYADQTERDYEAFLAAIRDGRLPAQEGA